MAIAMISNFFCVHFLRKFANNKSKCKQMNEKNQTFIAGKIADSKNSPFEIDYSLRQFVNYKFNL